MAAGEHDPLLHDADDVSCRARVFRAKLIEEFHLDESALSFGAKCDPKFSTAELFRGGQETDEDAETFRTLLRHAPMQPVKFKIFKRSQDSHHSRKRQHKTTDKRMVRVRNLNSVPIAVWAHWISNSEFQFARRPCAPASPPC